MNRYQQRDDVLKTIGFASYREYLASPLWQSIRRRLFAVCKICPCGNEATEFHHRTYKKRYLLGRGKIHKFITPICRDCHQRIEFDGERKVALGWANSRLDEIIEESEQRGIKRPTKCRTRRNKKKSARFHPAENTPSCE